MTPQELDKLFRQKLANREVPYEESSWLSMERLLDERQAIPLWKQGWVRWTGGASVAAAAVILAVTLFTPSSDPSPVQNLPELPVSAQPNGNPTPGALTLPGNSGSPSGGSDAPASEALTSSQTSSGTPAGSSASPQDAAAQESPVSTGQVNEAPSGDYVLTQTANNPATSDFAAGEAEQRETLLILPVQDPFAPVGHNGWAIERNSNSPVWEAAVPASFNLIGGLNIAQAYRNNGVKDMESASADFFAGLQFRMTLNGRWAYQGGLLYSRRGALNAHRSFDAYDYNFGLVHTHTEVTSQKLHWLEMPLGVEYSLATRHYLESGAYLAYLLSATNSVTTTVTHQFAPEGVRETRTAQGYDQAFARWDYGLYAGYGFRLNPYTALGLRVSYGFADNTRNEEFSVVSLDNNLQARLYLTYSLF